MNSPVDIANSALTKVGGNLIVSFQDGSDTANIVATRYDPIRRAVLRSHPWNCNRKRVVLAALTAPLPFGCDFSFQLPPDCLRVISVNDRNKADGWKVEGRLLLTSNIFPSQSSGANLLYGYDLQDVTSMGEDLAEAIAACLAADIVFKITQSFQMQDALKKAAVDMVRKAKLPDSQENSTQVLTANEFLDARLAGTTGIAWGTEVYNYPTENVDNTTGW